MARGARLLDRAGRVTALLGPTNTGKTHRAIERMLGHKTGMIGLPLRLLAREVYDRVVARKGPDAVALVTGEEKRVPRAPSYFVCTVEAMPLDRPVAFLAVDEVQLAGDRQRGHVFTDRILYARGQIETMFLGSETIAGLLDDLVPDLRIESAPRLSRLTYAGSRKVPSLPRRSAVIAFSAEQVYTHAERLRAVLGGTAVVLGALSPRARNAQVELYESGRVHHMVATDAIGMGLNMDIRHVAFSAVRKFDGRRVRDLWPAEVAQIAGRAGRHQTDGTFGATREVGELDAELIAAVEAHRFEPVRRLYYRNSRLDFSSPEALLHSLEEPPPRSYLVRVRDEDDQRALRLLLERDGVRRLAAGRLEALWALCQVPDYRKTLTGSHVDLLEQLAPHLLRDDGGLPTDLVAARVERLDRTEGDIETLMARIAYIRTWTYVAHQRGWLQRPDHWQERLGAVEDRLSDALSAALTQRFVDRRVMVAVHGDLRGQLEVEGGRVRSSGVALGTLRGLSFLPEGGAVPRGVRAAVAAALKPWVAGQLQAILDGSEPVELDAEGQLRCGALVLGRAAAGPVLYEPRVQLLRHELLEPAEREALRTWLGRWLSGWVDELLGPLRSPGVEQLKGPPRGIAHALEQGLGVVRRAEISAQVSALAPADRKALAALDVRLGIEAVFVASLLLPEAVARRARLWTLFAGADAVPDPIPVDAPPSVTAGRAAPGPWWALGYRVLGPRAVRVDVAERLSARLRAETRRGRGVPTEPLLGWLECGADDLVGVVRALGFRVELDGDQLRVARPGRRRRGRNRGAW